jgi:hypothetical protein
VAWSELRGVVKPTGGGHVGTREEEEEEELALLALCNLFSRQATRKSDIVYTYSVVAFGLALWL